MAIEDAQTINYTYDIPEPRKDLNLSFDEKITSLLSQRTKINNVADYKSNIQIRERIEKRRSNCFNHWRIHEKII